MQVKVTGVRETLRALKKVAPDLEKETRKAINKAVRDVVGAARGFVPASAPMSGWTPGSWGGRGWETAQVTRGIKRSNPSRRARGGGWIYGIDVINQSAAGMIYEVAGSKSDGRTRSGQQFITNIERSGLRRPLRRLVVRAGVEKGDEAKRDINRALEDAQRTSQRRLDQVNG